MRSRAMLMQNLVQRGNARHPPQGKAPHPTTATDSATFASVDPMGLPMPFSRNAEIYGEAEPADYVYKVLTGAVRIYRILDDGRRQISAFCLPGEVFGLEAGDEHHCSAEAVTDCTVLVIRRSALVARARQDGETAHQLWAVAARELEWVQDHM